jgi:hypothetical protein
MEAAREKARYDAQMLGWRASQEQKKARQAGGNQQIIDVLTSGPVLQAYATHLDATQHNYPEAWFQMDPSSQATSVDSALQLLGMKEQQQRELFAQQQLEHFQQLQQSSVYNMLTRDPNASGGASIADAQMQFALQNLGTHGVRNDPYRAEEKEAKKASVLRSPNDSLRQVRFESANPSTSFELRAEEYLARPMVFEQTPSVVGPAGVHSSLHRSMLQQRQLLEGTSTPSVHQPPRQQFGEESAFTADLIQQTFWASSAGRQPDQHFGEEPFRVPRVEHRSSLGTTYLSHTRPFLDHPSRMLRSQSYPSATSTSLSPKIPSPEESLGRSSLDSRGSGLATPWTPRLSPHSNTHSILNTPSLFPTPPQETDGLTMSPRDGFEMPRPRSEPPPTFPTEEEFQAIDFRYFDQRHSTFQPPAPPHHVGATGLNIRLSEEMVTEPNDNDTHQQNPSLFRDNLNALGSRLDNDGVDFLANLKFED